MSQIDQELISKLEQERQSNSEQASFIWQSAASTHTGRVRASNEDAFLESSDEGLWLVADGMGGHSRGDYASRAIVKAFNDFRQEPGLSKNLNDIETRLLSANETCLNAFKGKRVGSTVVALLIINGLSFFIWAGDSRIYRLRNDQLELMTEDHSLGQERVNRGELTLEELADHPSAHVLTRAIGVHKNLSFELRYSDVQPGDRFLICSDGLYYALSNDLLKSKLQQHTPSVAMQELMELALDYGGRDNLTAIVVEACKNGHNKS